MIFNSFSPYLITICFNILVAIFFGTLIEYGLHYLMHCRKARALYVKRHVIIKWPLWPFGYMIKRHTMHHKMNDVESYVGEFITYLPIVLCFCWLGFLFGILEGLSFLFGSISTI